MLKINGENIMPHAIESYRYSEDEKQIGFEEGRVSDSIIVRTVSGKEHAKKVKNREEYNKLAENIELLVNFNNS
jgi:hypothetical protein